MLEFNRCIMKMKFKTSELLDYVDVILYEQGARKHLVTINFQRSLPQVSQIITIKGIQERESMIHRYRIAELLSTIKIEWDFSIFGNKIRHKHPIQFYRG
jgi:hypothetical protein